MHRKTTRLVRGGWFRGTGVRVHMVQVEGDQGLGSQS